MCHYLSSILFLISKEMNTKFLTSLLEEDLEQELVLDMVEVQERSMVVELVEEQEYS